MRYFILDVNGEPIETYNMIEWSLWSGTFDRQIVDTTVGDVRISTVFIGMHTGIGASRPMIYETMTFGADGAEVRDRYETRDEAIAGHKAVVALVMRRKASSTVVANVGKTVLPDD